MQLIKQGQPKQAQLLKFSFYDPNLLKVIKNKTTLKRIISLVSTCL